jgi:hypothetical protein
MSKKLLLVGALVLVPLLAGCGRIATVAVSTVRVHPFPADGVVCYTWSTSMSCVKVR